MITKVTTFNLFLPSRVYFFDSSTCCAPRDGMRDVAAADKAHKADKADKADNAHLPAQWNENSVWNNIIWYSLTAVPL